MEVTVHSRAGEALTTRDPLLKGGLVRALACDWKDGQLSIEPEEASSGSLEAGFPENLDCVAPKKLRRRGGGSAAARVALFHAVAHIEFSAINLALDAVFRFKGQPRGFYGDWIQVALEEVGHFELIQAHLRRMGAEYGALPVHTALWDIAAATAGDPLERMALIPRYLEARGLDVNPGMQARLREAGDLEGVAILEVILRDEIGHVARGDRWFRFFCERRNLVVEDTYRTLICKHIKRPWRGPFHCEARREAGFSAEELRSLGCE